MLTSMVTNSEIARLLGVSESMISRIRNGQRRASPPVMLLISQKFNVSGDKLLSAHASGLGSFRDFFNDLVNEYYSDRIKTEDRVSIKKGESESSSGL